MPVRILILLPILLPFVVGLPKSYAQTSDLNSEIQAVVSFTVQENGYYHFKLLNFSLDEEIHYWIRKGNVPAHEELWWDGDSWKESNLGSWCAEGFTKQILDPGNSVILRVPDLGYQRFRIVILCTKDNGKVHKTIWSPVVTAN